MIKKLQHTDLEMAKQIRAVFQVSYAVEAELLKAVDFPPLQRELESFISSSNDFFGYFENDTLAAVVEIAHRDTFLHIQSLVVAPKFFRRGIAGVVMEFVLKSFDTNLFMVETGVANLPAIQLYKKYGFTEVKQWDTDFGIRKVRFELRQG
ncbi:GNAT family N-acetyltransferase [Cochleicola gelatinilyticus]|uniref:GNAT family acetyltransferase n=1 Tax=Cochleicola gelatinilyticus TaxID=1763537 RepID=A0A167IHT9_9FLAO|nr:GNAT family N-acetyltransferase [Cochleicola gelatinilyticus]OAB79665.1 GNAT family acetyltransferase [Cochleicola gelatinilyticus]